MPPNKRILWANIANGASRLHGALTDRRPSIAQSFICGYSSMSSMIIIRLVGFLYKKL